MNTGSPEYKISGLKRILSYKPVFNALNITDEVALTRFVNLFCEYQLADNNYMNIQYEAGIYKDDNNWLDTLSLDQVLQYITYIIWTDKFVTGYLLTRVKDNTIYRLLCRIETLFNELVP